MSDHQRTSQEQFIIVAPIGKDAELIAEQLAGFGIQSLIADSDVAAVEFAAAGAAGVIMTEEALTSDGLAAWQRFGRTQPPWSDVPVLLLGSFGAEFVPTRQLEKVRQSLGNVTLLDRPLRTRLLLSAVNSALRARRRQYEMRDTIIAQQETERALRQSEKLAVAGRLAATISHEINNPLSAVANLLYLAQTKSTDPECLEYLRMAEDELRRASEIVRETLRFHRASTTPATTDVCELLDSSIALFSHKLTRQGIRLEKDYANDLTAYCSAGEMRQAIVNIIVNAIDAMQHGGRLRVSAKRLSGLRRDGIMIFVADTGTGIPPEVRGRMFDQFFTTKGTVGTGLGLWLTRDVVHRNHGRLRFRSRTAPPSGTVFALWLPCTGRAVENTVPETSAVA